MKIYRYRLMISGNLHRLGFRHTAIMYARSLGLSGFAGYDGDLLFIEAEGPEDSLSVFVKWCKKGPQDCIIRNFDISEMEPLNSIGFVISPSRPLVLEQ